MAQQWKEGRVTTRLKDYKGNEEEAQGDHPT